MIDPAARLSAALASPDEEERRRAIGEVPAGWHEGVLALLVEAMGDTSWRVRKDAVARVARWPDVDGAVALLISTLSDDSNVGLRNAAVEALAAIGAPSVPSLALALEAGGDHRKFLVDALGAIGLAASGAAPVLIASLDDADENVRAAAAEALGSIGGREAITALRARLGGTDLLAAPGTSVERASSAHERPLPDLLAAPGTSVERASSAHERPLPARLAAPGTSVERASSAHERPLLARLAALEALNRLEAELDPARLVPMLGDPVLRRAALEALGLSGEPEALPHLLAALADRVRAVRETAQLGLVRLHETLAAPLRPGVEAAVRDAADLPMLAASMSSERGDVRRATATLLGWTRRADAVAPLVEALRDEETGEVAGASLAALGPAAVATLIGVLGDDDSQASAVAARVLGEVGVLSALEPLIAALARDDDPAVPLAAARALARVGASHPAEVRAAVVARPLEGPAALHLCRVLGSVGTAEDRPALLSAIRAEDAEVRRAACRAVVSLGAHRDVTEALIYALADEEAGVRSAAAEGLGTLADRAATKALVGALHDEDEAVRADAARALGKVGDPAAVAPLVPVARQHGPVAIYALEALARLEGADPALFVEALDAEDPEVVKAAVRALGASRGDSGALRGALGHSRWDVRRLVAETLAARAGEPGVADALRARAKVEEDAMVREALDAALGRR